MNFLPIASLLVYSFGIYAFGALTWYQIIGATRRESCLPRASSSRLTQALGTTLMIVCFAWFVVKLLMTLTELIHGWSSWLAFAQVLLLFLFPPLIIHMGHSEARDNGLAPSGILGQFHRVVWPVSQLCSFGLLLSFWGWIEVFPERWLSPILGLSIAALFVVTAIHGVRLAQATRRSRETPLERSSRRWTIALFSLLVLMLVPMVITNMRGAGWGELFQFVGGSMPLAFIFSGLYHENRFEFFDLFIKRGMALFLTIVLLTLYLALVLPRLDGLELGWARPWVHAVVLLPLVTALPWLYRKLGSFLDNRWLGRRFTTVDAVKRFLSGLQSATDEADLVERAQRGLSAIFHAPARIVLELAEAPRNDFERVQEVPIVSDGVAVGVILMGHRDSQMPYFSQDLSLLASLGDVFSYTLENVRLHGKKQEQERLARELTLNASRSELKALRAQINPHFLFNALNAIAGLIHKDPARADSTVEQLAEVFRYTLRGSENEWALLEDEMEFVAAYLEVERARFGERLQIEVSVDDRARSTRIPMMVIQTLVENAVKHGVSSLRRAGRISVHARIEGERLVVEVIDNGPGFPATGGTNRKGASYGLKNVRQRLAGYFGDDASLTTERDDDDERTVVTLSLPADHPATRDGAGSRGAAGGSGGAA